jgi:hypothetical protein
MRLSKARLQRALRNLLQKRSEHRLSFVPAIVAEAVIRRNSSVDILR